MQHLQKLTTYRNTSQSPSNTEQYPKNSKFHRMYTVSGATSMKVELRELSN